MITFLHAISYVAAVVGFIFVTLSLASGLLWIAEVIEEHTKLAKKIGRRSIYVVIIFHLLFLVLDKFPLWKIAFSIGCHLVYLRNFSSAWPMINLTSPSFIASCVLVLADHFIWFRHFSVIAARARTPIRATGASPYARPTHASFNNGNVYHQGVAFMDVASFFAICVWFIPLYLFLSLSANDNALPSFGSNPAAISSAPAAKKQPLITTLFTSVAARLPRSIVPRRVRQTFGGRRDDTGGLLAPPSPGTLTPSGSSLFAPSIGYEPWGGGVSPGAYTPGGSPLGAAGTPTFRSAIPNHTALRTPPPPQRRTSGTEYSGSARSAAATPSGSPRGPTISLGLPSLSPPPSGASGAQIRRKTSNLALNSTTADSSKKDD